MNIKTIPVGELQANCYILELGDACLIIDPGAEKDKIISNIDPSKQVIGIIITHSHDDHIGALNDLLFQYKCPIFNNNNLMEGRRNIENFVFSTIYAPGHKEDEIVLYFEKEKKMFTGDFIFNTGIGRIDLPGGNAIDMKASITKILNYPDDITIYPGHGPITTLGAERNNLNYFKTVI